jgi:type III pantothenate kinase
MRPVVAVDLGNSAAKLMLRLSDSTNDSLWPVHSISIHEVGWTRQAIQWVDATLSTHKLAEPEIEWRIASVHRQATRELTEALARTSFLFWLVTWRDLPIPVDVVFPERVGIDRLVGCFAASLLTKPPLVVVDAGSAITVDLLLEDAIFSGGAILPGLRLQADSLARGTDALPQLDWEQHLNPSIPGRETLSAMALGILTSVGGGIDRLIGLYQANNSKPRDLEPLKVFVTGGDAKLVASQMTVTTRIEPNLVCRGLLMLPPKTAC